MLLVNFKSNSTRLAAIFAILFRVTKQDPGGFHIALERATLRRALSKLNLRTAQFLERKALIVYLLFGLGSLF